MPPPPVFTPESATRAGMALLPVDAEKGEYAFRLYQLQDIVYKHQLSSLDDVSIQSDELSNKYAGKIQMEFLLIHKISQASEETNQWILFYQPSMIDFDPSMEMNSYDFLAIDDSGLNSSRYASSPTQLFLSHNFYIQQAIPLSAVPGLENSADLSSWLKPILNHAESTPMSISRIIFSAEGPNGKERIGIYTDIGPSGDPSEPDGPPKCTQGGSGERKSLYCRIVSLFSQ